MFVQVRNADRSEKARELLAAAEKAGLDPSVVRHVDGGYEVPDELVAGDQADEQTQDTKPAKQTGRRTAGKDGQ